MDETAQFADIILPNHIYLERYEDVATPPMFQKPMLSLANRWSNPSMTQCIQEMSSSSLRSIWAVQSLMLSGGIIMRHA
jgi:anaerobic selenocysteine-containing dehydrogenase